MRDNHARKLVRLLLAAALVALAAPAAVAQQEPAPADETATAEEGSAQPELGQIDQLLEGEAEILSGRGYSYDPANRRDPFKSLLETSDAPTREGPRPEGIPGLLIDEIVLSGIFNMPDGYRAQVQAADRQKSYLIKAGDQLYDGDVIRITDNEVVFRQNVQDPTALKPFREVVKTLNP